jgi:hypothetical protein
MTAVRIPLLGMAVAVALLVVETVGAIAYHDHAVASSPRAEVTEVHRAAMSHDACADGACLQHTHHCRR